MTKLLSAAVEPVIRRGHARAEGSAGDEAAVAADPTLFAPTCRETAMIVMVN